MYARDRSRPAFPKTKCLLVAVTAAAEAASGAAVRMGGKACIWPTICLELCKTVAELSAAGVRTQVERAFYRAQLHGLFYGMPTATSSSKLRHVQACTRFLFTL